MKITCEKKELVQAIQTVLKAVPSRPQMPILSGIYIKAHQNYIELQGTDYEISIICKIKAIIETEGTIVLPGKYLYEVVRTLPGEYVEIKNNDSDNSVNIRSNSAQFNLLNMQENEFPIIEPLKGQINFNLKNDIFLNFIKKTSFACATDESRPVFTGCLMDITDENIVMAATNMLSLIHI